MGLDIYFYTIKDKAKYNRYRAAAKKYDTISDAMHAKYKESLEIEVENFPHSTDFGT